MKKEERLGSFCDKIKKKKNSFVSDVAKERLSLGRLACTFQQANSNSVLVVYIDSQGVVALSKNSIHHNAWKHINVWYDFVWDCITIGKLDLEKISMIDNVADGMANCLSIGRFQSLKHQMGVRRNQSNWVKHRDGLGLSASIWLQPFGLADSASVI